AGQPDALPIGDPGGHLHVQPALARPAPPAPALAAGVAGKATLAVAGLASHGPHHLSERGAWGRLQLATAAAALARLDPGSPRRPLSAVKAARGPPPGGRPPPGARPPLPRGRPRRHPPRRHPGRGRRDVP